MLNYYQDQKGLPQPRMQNGKKQKQNKLNKQNNKNNKKETKTVPETSAVSI